MKFLSSFSCAVLIASLVLVSGCTKRRAKEPLFEGKDTVMTQVATGLKTKAGKNADVYEFVNSKTKSTTILIILDNGKLVDDPKTGWTLDGKTLGLDLGAMQNIVLVAKAGQFFPGWMQDVKPEAAKAKCVPGAAIDLPVDEALKNVPMDAPAN